MYIYIYIYIYIYTQSIPVSKMVMPLSQLHVKIDHDLFIYNTHLMYVAVVSSFCFIQN